MIHYFFSNLINYLFKTSNNFGVYFSLVLYLIILLLGIILVFQKNEKKKIYGLILILTFLLIFVDSFLLIRYPWANWYVKKVNKLFLLK